MHNPVTLVEIHGIALAPERPTPISLFLTPAPQAYEEVKLWLSNENEINPSRVW